MTPSLEQVLQSWQEKLTALRVEEVTTIDPNAKFALAQNIKECQEKIREIKEELNQQKPPEKDNFTQYREKVRRYLEDHRLSDAERITLEQDARRLRLSVEEAKKILAEEMAPLLQARKDYGDLLEALIDGGCDLGNVETARILKESQQEIKLLDWEVKEIEKAITFKKQLKTVNFEIVFVNQQGGIIQKENKQAKYFSEDLGKGIILEMVAIEGGKFMMGTEDEEIERLRQKYNRDWYRIEKPRHEVTLAPFYMAKYPITQEQWKAVALLDKVEIDLDPDPSSFKLDKNPVERVSWTMVVEFCKRLSKLTGKNYKLPTEAQWEYACRAGSQTPFYFGATLTTDLANYNGNYTFAEEKKGIYIEKTTPVGQFPPNAFGLYDMHGNVWEWCDDDWHENYQSAPTDGSSWLNMNDFQQLKILRGGSWLNYPDNCRSAHRNWYNADSIFNFIGFRVVCVGAGLL